MFYTIKAREQHVESCDTYVKENVCWKGAGDTCIGPQIGASAKYFKCGMSSSLIYVMRISCSHHSVLSNAAQETIEVW